MHLPLGLAAGADDMAFAHDNKQGELAALSRFLERVKSDAG
jgi:hypothetical protein